MKRRTNSLWVPLLFLLAMAAAVAEPRTDVEMANATTSITPQGNNDNIEVGNNKTTTNTAVVNNNKRTYNGGGGSYGWGWGGGGGGGGGRGGGGGGEGWGWGGGGGGGGYYSWRGCNNGNRKGGRMGKRGKEGHKKRVYGKEEYKIGEFAECMNRGRCRGVRLDCPLHCGGPCFYDCHYMCKAHCRRP